MLTRAFRGTAWRKCAVLLAALLLGGCDSSPPAPAAPAASTPDPLDKLGVRATSGAAPGYLADAVCRNCHTEIWESYQHVGMAQSFRRPGNERPVEDFGIDYVHSPTETTYRIVETDSGPVFERFQLDAEGEPINKVELPVSWIIGSGNKVRSYAYQNALGEMFMLPLSWYSESRQWAMSPGFEHRQHPGISRRMTRSCLFCHNAYPEVARGSDAFWESDRFPAELPEGTGCQRCHGPGADHVRTVLAGGSDVETIRSKIVNPGRLEGEHRDSVCFQCHMLPSVSVMGSRKIGRSYYSYRPGELLSDYLVHVEVSEDGISREDQFEINHHGYRFYLSSCYQESAGELACISCHNPHEKPESAAIRKTSSTVCSGCHAAPETLHTAASGFDADDCVSCHMPERRTTDVIEATMTDHKIVRGPVDLDAAVAPRRAERYAITGLELLDFGEVPTGAARDYYRYSAIARANRFLEAARSGLRSHLDDHPYLAPTPYIDLAKTEIQTGDYGAAELTLTRLLESYPNLHIAHTLLGTALLAQGKREQAIAALKRSVDIQPDPETWFNLALAYVSAGNSDDAEAAIDQAIELRPTLAAAWKYRGRLLAAKGQAASAIDALQESLRLEPRDADAYEQLVVLLKESGRDREAGRYLEVGLRVALDPRRLRGLN